LLQILAAVALARLVRDRAAIAVRSAAAYIFSFQAGRFDRLSATAFAWIAFAALATAIPAAAAKNPSSFLNGQEMHRNKSRSTTAFARFGRNEIAFAVIFTITYVVRLALVCGDEHADCGKQKYHRHCRDNRSLHTLFPPFSEPDDNIKTSPREEKNLLSPIHFLEEPVRGWGASTCFGFGTCRFRQYNCSSLLPNTG
jgi:hypothetical protein